MCCTNSGIPILIAARMPLSTSLWTASLERNHTPNPCRIASFNASTPTVWNVTRKQTCVLERIPAIVLFGPLLFPIAKLMGVHEVHYAMVVIIAMGIGLFTPPFGVGYNVACAVGRVNPDEGMRPIVGYMMSLAVGLIVVAAIPWISIGFLK